MGVEGRTGIALLKNKWYPQVAITMIHCGSKERLEWVGLNNVSSESSKTNRDNKLPNIVKVLIAMDDSGEPAACCEQRRTTVHDRKSANCEKTAGERSFEQYMYCK